MGVLATRQTVEGDYLRNLIVEHAAGCDVVSLSSPGLVVSVENGLFRASPEERQSRVRQEVDRFRSEGIDALVLGSRIFSTWKPSPIVAGGRVDCPRGFP